MQQRYSDLSSLYKIKKRVDDKTIFSSDLMGQKSQHEHSRPRYKCRSYDS